VQVKGRLKLIDFGIADAIIGDTTNVLREVPVGTLNFIAPESLKPTYRIALPLIRSFVL
jgi:serine/threonine protein kinase